MAGDVGPDGWSRRGLIKAAAVAGAAGATQAAFGGLSFGGALGTPAAAVAATTSKGAFRRYTLTVEIPGCPESSALIESVDIDPTVVEVLKIEGPDGTWVEVPGPVHWGTATLTARVGEAGEFQQWLDVAAAGLEAEKDVLVRIEDSRTHEARAWRLLDAFPTKWDPGDFSPTSNIPTETITVKLGRVEFL